MRTRHLVHQGFTLLEVLIAMTLSVFLLAVVTVGMRTVIDEWQDRSTGPFEERVDAGLVLMQLERALLGASPHSYVDQDTLETYVYFPGTDESVSWVSTVSPQAKQQLTAWQLSAGERDGVLMKAVPAFSDNPFERFEESDGTIILPGYDMSIAYLELDQLDRPEWLDEWDATEYQQLPMAVRLIFTNRDAGNRDDETIELVVPFLQRQHESIQPVEIQ